MTSGSSYPPKNDFKEGSKEAEVPGSAGFIKNLRLALDGNLASLNDTSNTARAATPSEVKLESAPHRAEPRIPDLNREDKARVMKLVSELTQSQQERSQLQIRVEKMKRQNASVIAEMNEYKLKLSQAVSQLQSCIDKIESLKAEREEANDQRRRVQLFATEVAEAFKMETDVMRREREALLSRYSTKEREVMRLKTRCENLKQALLKQKGLDMQHHKEVMGPQQLSWEFAGTMGRAPEENNIEDITERCHQSSAANHTIKSPFSVRETQDEVSKSIPKRNTDVAIVGNMRGDRIVLSPSSPSATMAFGGGNVGSVESCVKSEEACREQRLTSSSSLIGPLREQRLNATEPPELLPIEEAASGQQQLQSDPTLSLIQLVDELDASA